MRRSFTVLAFSASVPLIFQSAVFLLNERLTWKKKRIKCAFPTLLTLALREWQYVAEDESLAPRQWGWGGSGPLSKGEFLLI
jgi:hypothetical protein